MNNRFIWLGGNILPIEDAKVNVLSPSAQFGANVFEGIRCYWNSKEQILNAFRLDKHYKRLQNSIKIFHLEEKYSNADFKKALVDVVKANNYKEDIAVRQTVFVDGFGSWFSTSPVNMFVAPITKERTGNLNKKGINCCISSWERISDKNISPKVKVGANYINSRMAQIEAVQNGYNSAIFLNNQGKISEGPGSCLFIVRDGVLITPPLTASILESITRETIIELARNVLKIEVIERDIDRTELYISDEVFLCGSAVEVTPVLNIDKLPIQSAATGEITKKIHSCYLAIVNGEIEKYKKWLTPIN